MKTKKGMENITIGVLAAIIIIIIAIVLFLFFYTNQLGSLSTSFSDVGKQAITEAGK